jgi:hypothetical protein
MYAEGAGRIDAKTETAIRKALKKGDVSINKIAPSLGTGTVQDQGGAIRADRSFQTTYRTSAKRGI